MNKEALAWAAGFFDGEGCFFFGTYRRKDGRIDQWTETRITQADREVLDRFASAVGLGKVYGPYARTKANHASQWQYVAYGFASTQAIVASLWTWLGSIKRDQARRVLLAGSQVIPRPYTRRRPERSLVPERP
jgi:hypothetical protein